MPKSNDRWNPGPNDETAHDDTWRWLPPPDPAPTGSDDHARSSNDATTSIRGARSPQAGGGSRMPIQSDDPVDPRYPTTRGA